MTGGLGTSASATCLMANVGCQPGPQLRLSAEAPTYDLLKWLGLPHSMVASGHSSHRITKTPKTRASEAFYDAALGVTEQQRHLYSCLWVISTLLKLNLLPESRRGDTVSPGSERARTAGHALKSPHQD